jgi:hypothetical protein
MVIPHSGPNPAEKVQGKPKINFFLEKKLYKGLIIFSFELRLAEPLNKTILKISVVDPELLPDPDP